jgi:hypothetical protein
MRLQPGQRAVVEPWSGEGPSYFSWDPAPALQPARARGVDLLQPLSDLRLALVFGGHAVARLFAGVTAIAWQSVFGARATYEEQACRRHGAMS